MVKFTASLAIAAGATIAGTTVSGFVSKNAQVPIAELADQLSAVQVGWGSKYYPIIGVQQENGEVDFFIIPPSLGEIVKGEAPKPTPETKPETGGETTTETTKPKPEPSPEPEPEPEPEVPDPPCTQNNAAVQSRGTAAVESSPADNAAECQDLCKNRDCAVAVYKEKQCSLFYKDITMVEEPGSKLIPRTCNTSCFQENKGNAADGNVVKNVANASVCQALCIEKNFCGQFTYRGSDKTCKLITSPAAGTVVTENGSVHGYYKRCD